MTQAHPLQWPDGWPITPHHKRIITDRFRVTFGNARNELVHELSLMGAANVVISSNMAVRADGLPYASEAKRRIEQPGVAVYFTLNGRSMVMARDGFSTVLNNLRSVGLAIAHLRGLERHGGATMMERAFSGFMALEAPRAGAGGRSWREVFGLNPGDRVSRETMEGRFRHLAKERHPDQGGNEEAFLELTVARAAALQEFGQ